jgi:hypothetical protein
VELLLSTIIPLVPPRPAGVVTVFKLPKLPAVTVELLIAPADETLPVPKKMLDVVPLVK